MGWLFVQVWLLCLVAFLAGAAVTWLFFVHPARRTAAAAPAEPAAPVPPDPGPEPAPAVDDEPAVGLFEPALSALDRRDGLRRGQSAGTAAADALDALGVGRTVSPPPGPVPENPPPPEAPAAPGVPVRPGPSDGSGPRPPDGH